MKAKELIKLLSQHPNADVVISDYNGWETPFYDVDAIEFHENSYPVGENIRKSAKPNNGLVTFTLGKRH
jgi:hypothetical protein